MTHRLTVAEEQRTDTGLNAAKRKTITLADVTGTVATSTGALRWYNDLGCALDIVSTRASVGTAPVGASLIVDINLSGTTIFTTQTARPTILVSTNTAQGGTPAVTTIPAGGYLTVDVDQVGSGTAGSNLRVTMVVSPSVN